MNANRIQQLVTWSIADLIAKHEALLVELGRQTCGENYYAGYTARDLAEMISVRERDLDNRY